MTALLPSFLPQRLGQQQPPQQPQTAMLAAYGAGEGQGELVEEIVFHPPEEFFQEGACLSIYVWVGKVPCGWAYLQMTYLFV